MIISNEQLMQTMLGIGEELTRVREAVTAAAASKPENSVEPIYMSAKQACERYGLSRDVIDKIINMADAPQTLKVGSRRLLPIKEYDTFMVCQFGQKERRSSV